MLYGMRLTHVCAPKCMCVSLLSRCAILVAVVASVLVVPLFAQPHTLGLHQDSLAETNRARFGFEKTANTFLFRADADLDQGVFGGNLLLKQNYRGSTIRSASAAFRDDENLELQYHLPLHAQWQAHASGLWQLSRDSRSIGLSSLTRTVTAAGVQYAPSDSIKMSVAAGSEYNKQLGYGGTGPFLALNGSASNLTIEQFRTDIRWNGEASFLGNRTNVLGDMSARFDREYDAQNILRLGVNYKILNRDFYTTLSLQSSPAVESRLERRITANGLAYFSVFSSVQATVEATFSSMAVGRHYKEYVPNQSNTGIERNLDEQQFSLSVSGEYNIESFRQALGLSFFLRDEVNTARQYFSDITPLQVDTLRQLERIRDNSAANTRLFAQSLWNPNVRDTIQLTGAISILRYDTPSVANNDDRDEVQASLAVGYAHRYSSFFSAGLQLQGQLNHAVFLKAARSALNNRNWVLRLAPSAKYEYNGFSFHPRLEVLAQYTVYDFEGRVSVPKSFSFRQLSVRDSIILPISERLYAETQLYFRSFQRAELYWEDFSEFPLSRNYEQFIKSLLYTRIEGSLLLGAGARWYALSQENTATVAATSTLLQSIAPECSIVWTFANGTTCTLNGWYEFQYNNKVHFRYLPNVFLSLQRPL